MNKAATTSLLHDSRWRGLLWQAGLALLVIFLVYEAAENAITNMRARGIPTNFDFWNRTSGFDINQTLISYSATSTYGEAFWVGLLNTLVVALIGIVFATLIGVIIGVMRLSQNVAARGIASVYVEVLRNTPLLLQLLFWYNAILVPLPAPRASLALPSVSLTPPDFVSSLLTALSFAAVILAWRMRGRFAPAMMAVGSAVGFIILLFGAGAFLGLSGGGILHWGAPAGVYLNNRGLFLPSPHLGEGAGMVLLSLLAAILAAVGYWIYARHRQRRSGQQSPVLLVATGLVVLLPLAAFEMAGRPVAFEFPALRGFNFQGGMRVSPEFVALTLGLVLYTAAFIAEVVRSGIQAVARGQGEAASALGLSQGQSLRLVIFPQAMRVIIPPLTNQYLNLTKNSSLAVFIGYPDLVQVFAGTVLNQTGAAVQVIAVTMGVYLFLSLVTSGLMALYNRRMTLVER